jgi:integrase/recombinase XerD
MKLSQGLELFVEQKRVNGYTYKKLPLPSLVLYDQIGDVELTEITTSDVSRVLESSQTSAVTWRKKYQFLQQFFDFICFREALPQLSMPPPRRLVRQTFIPYVYSESELRTLFVATVRCQESTYCTIDHRTLSMFLLFLYATGARLGEVLALKLDDFDQETGMLTLRGEKSNQCRRIPLNLDLQRKLRQYLRWRTADHIEGNYLFATKDGASLSGSTMHKVFRRLRRLAGVSRSDRVQPRMQDLRHTFAVHRITAWIRKGASLDRMLPALSVYMGHAGLETTERYLSMTPERFRKHLHKLSPVKGQKHWRDDKELMAFLSAL